MKGRRVLPKCGWSLVKILGCETDWSTKKISGEFLYQKKIVLVPVLVCRLILGMRPMLHDLATKSPNEIKNKLPKAAKCLIGLCWESLKFKYTLKSALKLTSERQLT